MKIAIVYNRESQRVINLFGVPNREKYGLRSIQRIERALRQGGHRVATFEGDKDLIHRLEDFMPQVLEGERPGMVFNLSYGIQGQARYTHVPGLLEMLGVPYVGSGPLAHALALDKVVAKILFQQHQVPTPEFCVLESEDDELPVDLPYPMIVKPKSEAVSFGIQIAADEAELRAAAREILEQFAQPVLCEQYIEGVEINVGLLGNERSVECFPPVELEFGEGLQIYTLEDKKGLSGREVGLRVPARLSAEKLEEAQRLAKAAFRALGCLDCARVDMRIDEQGQIHVLEINSLPSLGERGSYVHGAAAVGLDFAQLVCRLVEVASTRYFGTPHPPTVQAKSASVGELVFRYVTENRDRIEGRVESWTRMSSRSDDPVGLQLAAESLGKSIQELGLRVAPGFRDDPHVRCFETAAGLEGGTLLVAQLDVPVDGVQPVQVFRREPEWLLGEGIASSRAPLTQIEYALRALRYARRLSRCKVGLLVHADEGRDARYSREAIERASLAARQVLVFRPGNPGNRVLQQRRGHRRLRLITEDEARPLGKTTRKQDVLRWTASLLEEFSALSSQDRRLSLAAVDLETEQFPLLLPHRVQTTFLLAYGEADAAAQTVARMRERLGGGFRWQLQELADRPPLLKRKSSLDLLARLKRSAEKWDAPVVGESSLWPSVAGLVPAERPVLCGLGPVARDLYRPQEAVSRSSLIQRTMLLAQFLLDEC